MQTLIQVLSDEEQTGVHECTLKILAETGVRVNTEKGRRFLKQAGANVDEVTNIVRFPRKLVEDSIKLAPKQFTLGARRPDWDLSLNAGQCILLADGSGTSVIDRKTGMIRQATFNDWFEATKVIDALDEIGVYWAMVDADEGDETLPSTVNYWQQIFRNFSKHVQDSSPKPEFSPWLLEVLQAIFGDKESIREQHPFSFLLCPQSPLIIDAEHTDAYLAMLGWDIPVAVMPMPLMGGTGPGNMISMTILGNCEVIAMLCLIQAADPGTPFIYAPALAVMNPRTGMYSAGAVENALLSCAAIEMARYYGFPIEGTGGGTDTIMPGIQASYERALSVILPILSWPDILVGPGLLGGSMVMSLEQLVIDAEVFRMSRQLHRGIISGENKWLDEVINRIGPGGNFLGEKSTVEGIRTGEWLQQKIGFHESTNDLDVSTIKDIREEAREIVENLLVNHKPLPLDEDVERELEKISKHSKVNNQA